MKLSKDNIFSYENMKVLQKKFVDALSYSSIPLPHDLLLLSSSRDLYTIVNKSHSKKGFIMAEQYLFKNSINLTAIKNLAENIGKNDKDFDQIKFNRFFKNKLVPLSLTQRISLVTDALFLFLPDDYETALNILVKSLPDRLPNYSKGIEGYDSTIMDGLNGFIMVSITNYVSRYGLNHFKISMAAFHEMTKCFSAEGSIRYFIQQDTQKSLKLFTKWAKDKDMHVRRLVSESIRPRLPWTMGLPDFVKDPSPILPLLEMLKNDKELYVRRSVANNLNDISKDHPNVVTKLLKEWSKDKSKEMDWLIRHALRTLLKAGDKKALELLGYKSNIKINVTDISLKAKKVIFGSKLEFELSIESASKKDQLLMIDYIIHHMKANGKLAPKVFKLKKVNLKAGESLVINKKHALKEISTRKYYNGKHEVQLQINGSLYSKEPFTLKI